MRKGEEGSLAERAKHFMKSSHLLAKTAQSGLTSKVSFFKPHLPILDRTPACPICIYKVCTSYRIWETLPPFIPVFTVGTMCSRPLVGPKAPSSWPPRPNSKGLRPTCVPPCRVIFGLNIRYIRHTQCHDPCRDVLSLS